MSYDPNRITYFAITDARGQHVKFGIKAKDRQRHVYVIGKTGMGKSTLLENMAAQDIANGEGMAFIDPHGSAAETLLNYIPEERKKDVLYFAPSDTSNPISFNIMEDVGPDKRHLVVSGLMSVFEKIWVDAWSARMAYILQNTLMALLEYPGSTLLGVNRMLSDDNYRAMVIHNITDPAVKAFWTDEFLKYNERYMQEAGDAIKNKIGQFTSNPVIRNIIGQPHSSFNIREMMDEKKILIMNLSKGLIGESNANLLGSMLTTRIYLAAMSRADLSPEQMRDTPNFYFYVDEFQSFANATFANILSEARKYHLNLTIAHQYVAQMEEEVRDAVFGNVGTIISFRVGPFDAEVLETIFTPQFLATDIVNLGAFQIYLSLMIDGIGSQPFSAATLPPIEPPSISYRDIAIAESQNKFSRPREEVEKEVDEFHKPADVPPDVPDDYFPGGKKNPKNKAKNLKQSKGGDFGHKNDRGRSPQGNTPPQRGGHTAKPKPKVNPEEKLADLRATLKKVVGDKNDSEKKKQEEQSIEKKKGLQSAFQSAVKVDDQPKKNPSKNRKKRPKPERKKEEQSVYKQEKQTSETTDSKDKVNVEDRERGLGQEISPKELERMMRVTTSDKPPT